MTELHIPGGLEIKCLFNLEVVSLTCSVDGGEVENCSFPLDSERFAGSGMQMVLITATDTYGRSLSISFFPIFIPGRTLWVAFILV